MNDREWESRRGGRNRTRERRKMGRMGGEGGMGHKGGGEAGVLRGSGRKMRRGE